MDSWIMDEKNKIGVSLLAGTQAFFEYEGSIIMTIIARQIMYCG